MISIGIFYFSGTGNTEIIAKLLADAFMRREAKAQLIIIEEVLNKKVDFDPREYDLIGIGHPVLGFDATEIMYKFAKILPLGEKKKTFIFKTAADFIFINNGASKSLIKILRKKGYDVFYDSILPMPCNFLIKYEDEFVKQLYEAALKKVERISGEILIGKTATLHLNPIMRVLCKLAYYGEEKVGAKIFGKGLKTVDTCTHCKKCVKDCPTQNISCENNEIKFSSKCIWCMRCIYSCPEKAIKATWGKMSVLEGGFNGGANLQKILENPEIKADFVTEKTKGYYKHFYEYFRHP